MSQDEQIDLLKRELADLRDRVRRLEASASYVVPGLSGAPVYHTPIVPIPAGQPQPTYYGTISRPMTTVMRADGSMPTAIICSPPTEGAQ